MAGSIFSEVDGYDSEEVLDYIKSEMERGQVLAELDITWIQEGFNKYREWSLDFAPKLVVEKKEERRF